MKPTVDSGNVYGIFEGAPQKIVSGVPAASSRNSRTPSSPATTKIWSSPETTPVVPKGTTMLANIVIESLLHSRWMWPSMRPGTR